MELNKSNEGKKGVLWTLYGAEFNKSRIVMDIDELIETYNLIQKELKEIGVLAR